MVRRATVSRDRANVAQVQHDLTPAIYIDCQPVGDLRFRGRALQLSREIARDGLDLLMPAAKITRRPVQLAQAVENCAFDPVLRKARKHDLLFRVEPRGSVKQSEYTGVHQVVEINVCRQVFIDTNGNCFDQR
jgi:hypothetical protein